MRTTPRTPTPPMLTLSPALAAPLELATEAIAILGRRGSGKTNTAVVLVEELLGAGVQTVVVDTVGVWWGLRSSADGKHAGLDVVVFGGEHADVPLQEHAGQVIADAILDHHLSAVIDTSGLRKAEARRFLLGFVTRLYERKAKDRHPIHVVFDESDELAPQRTDTRAGNAGPALLGAMEDFVRRGRARGLGCTLVTQRPAVLNKDVLTQVEVLIAMQMTGPTDRAAIDAWTSQHADDDQARQVKASLSSLPTGTGWVWSPTLLTTPLQKIPFRPRTTYDSSATHKVGQTRHEPTARTTIDLTRLGEQITATVEAAKANDPTHLRHELTTARTRITQLEHEAATPPPAVPAPEPVIHEIPVLTEEDKTQLATLQLLLGKLNATITDLIHTHRTDPAPPRTTDLTLTATPINRYAGAIHPAKRTPRTPPQTSPTTAATPTPAPQALAEGQVRFRAGAQRMLESLGRMAPLRLTKGQWGTVSHMKTSGGTWSTYLGELRRAALIDEDTTGFTLTDAGFDYLGGRPAPMTAAELQDHYRSILRSGAVRMLDTLIDAYPTSVLKDELSDRTGIASTGGTFSTYLGELTRNGLAERTQNGYRATDILMHGATS